MKSFSVGETTPREWVRQGLLVGKRQRVNSIIHGLLNKREMIDSFRRTYVFAKEAAELLDVKTYTIYEYVSRGFSIHWVQQDPTSFFVRRWQLSS